MKKYLVMVLFFSFMIGMSITPIFGDAGDTNSYDGGSSSGSSSSSHNDTYYYSSSSSRRSSNSSSGEISGDAVGCIIFWMIIIGIFAVKASSPKNGRSGPPIIVNEEKAKKAVLEIETNFNFEDFKEKVSTIFVQLQTQWTKREWEAMKEFETPELFLLHKSQIEGYIRRRQINVIERIHIKEIKFYKFEQINNKQYITVYLQARMTDYIKDELTHNVIKGSTHRDQHLRYLLTFVRTTADTCPACGAPHGKGENGVCSYCRTHINSNWLLSKLEGINN